MSGLGALRGHLAQFEKELPGFTDILGKVEKGEISSLESTRQQLNCMKDTAVLQQRLNGLSEDLRALVREFMDGKTVEEVSSRFKLPLNSPVKPRSQTLLVSEVTIGGEKATVLEDDGTFVQAIVDLPFVNWSATISNNPRVTFFPTTIGGVKNIVKLAKKKERRVRVAGFRQTWSDLYSEDFGILVSLVALAVATGTSADVHADAVDGPRTEFNQIKLATNDVSGSDGKKRWARIGAGVSNEAFRIWSIKQGWTLGSNVIAVENTFGGVNAPICHGSGLLNKTPNDSVREIRYVDANGELQCISNPTHIKAAAGAFGLLGIITELTFELEKTTYAELHPLKEDIQLAIPPPEGFQVPKALEGKYTNQQFKDAESDFIRKASSYYSEWFWFPYKPQIWVNCWNNTPDPTDAIDTPDEWSTLIQWLENLSDACLNSHPAFKKLPGRIQGSINGTNMMNRSPPTDEGTGIAKTYLINGIHYRRGTHNFPILDTEFEIPIPALASDPNRPDWSWVRRAWWDAVSLAYDDEYKTGAVRIGIEMRILSDSNVIMAPQTGNRFGTASIEIVSTQPAGEDKVWHPFVQRIVDKWTAYEINGEKLNVRPHWAKEWEPYTIGGAPIKQHLKDFCYKEEIPMFKHTLRDIGKEHNWDLRDIKERFSNRLLDSLFFE